MRPDIWGKHGWFFLHSITLNYSTCPTVDEKKNIKNFFNNVGNVLPCEKCQYHYKKHIEKHPLTNQILNSKDKLVRWLFDIHNEVNILTGKPKMEYDKFISDYAKYYNGTQKYDETNNDNKTQISKQSPNYFNISSIIIIVIFIIIILIVFFSKYKKNKNTNIIPQNLQMNGGGHIYNYPYRIPQYMNHFY